jgi:hypothetical protein
LPDSLLGSGRTVLWNKRHPTHFTSSRQTSFGAIWPLVIRGYQNRPRWAKFDEPEQLLNAITEFLDAISVEELKAASDGWVERVRWVTEKDGIDYQLWPQ